MGVVGEFNNNIKELEKSQIQNLFKRELNLGKEYAKKMKW